MLRGRLLLLAQNAESGVHSCMDKGDVGGSKGDVQERSGLERGRVLFLSP